MIAANKIILKISVQFENPLRFERISYDNDVLKQYHVVQKEKKKLKYRNMTDPPP